MKHNIDHRPGNLRIIVRDNHFDFNSYKEKHFYWNSDKILSHFVNAFQQTFPEGERLFIEAAMDCNALYGKKNPIGKKLEHDFTLFRKQEVRHGYVHKLWTEKLIEYGYDQFKEYNKEMVDFRNWFRKRFHPKFRLAYTTAAEHYTASLAFIFVHIRPELITNSASPFREILLYHSMEELEHKAVCFDLFKHYSGNYLTYLLGFIYLSFDLFRMIRKRFRYLLSKDGIWDKTHLRMLRKFFLGKGGLIRLSMKRVMSYLRPGFHPWENDDRGNMRKKFSAIMETSGIQDFKMT